MPKHLSVSAVNKYSTCPRQYELTRVLAVKDRPWERPDAWRDHGTAVHMGIEAYEKSGRTLPLEEAQKVASDAYRARINRLLAETPNTDYWFSSGPYKGTGYTGKNGRYFEPDIERRAKLVPVMVERYYDWIKAHPEDVIWVSPDDSPGIEYGFYVDFDGISVKGFIDQVLATPRDDMVFVRDVKTGAQPGDTFQLKVYAMALELAESVDVLAGDYWMGKKGEPTKAYDLSTVSRQEVIDTFHEVNEKIEAGQFEPTPGEHCDRCPVRMSCEVGGFDVR